MPSPKVILNAFWLVTVKVLNSYVEIIFMTGGFFMEPSVYDLTYNDLNPRFLFCCNLLRTEPEMNYHCHDFIEFVFILKGKTTFRIDEKLYDVEEGSVILLNPGTYHQSLPAAETSAQKFYLAFSNVEFAGCTRGHFPLFKNYQLLTTLPDSYKKPLFRLCNLMEQESKTCRPGRYFMLKSYLIQVICLLCRYQKQALEEDAKRRYEFKSIDKKYVVQQIMHYMETHYKEKISLDQIAANMYLSSFYISKIFKSETGDTPINYLISLRMQKARELLDENPEQSIQAVAMTVGYEDAYHFSKLFKKYFGLSPLYYKARIPQ